MRVKHWPAISAVFLCSIFCAAAGPVLVGPGDRDGDEVRAAAEGFLKAVAVADIDTARARFAGDETQAGLLDAHLRFANSFNRLRQTVSEHFGPAPRTVGGNLVDDRARASKSHYVVLNGEVAALGSGGFLDPGLRLRRVEGVWKVTHLAAGRWEQREFAGLLGAFADACDSVRGRVKAGAVASADAAWQGLDEPVRTAVRGYATPAPRPAPAADPGGRQRPEVPTVEAFQANFGQPIESESVRRLIAALPGTPALTEGRFWRLLSAEAGIEMTFDEKTHRLAAVFFYAPGANLTDGYPGPFPQGLTAGATRRDVEKHLGPPPLSRGGTGIEYEAEWPVHGITVQYDCPSARDARCRLRHVLLTPPPAGPRVEPRDSPQTGRSGPRLTFRLVATDAKEGDLLPNPSDPRAPELPVMRDVLLDGSGVAEMRPVIIDEDRRQLGILLKLTQQGADRMRRVTAANIGRQLAIVVDGTVVAAPVIRETVGMDVVFDSGSGLGGEGNRAVDRLHAAVNALPPEEGDAERK